MFHFSLLGFPGDTVVKNPPANAADGSLIPSSGIPWRKRWHPTLVFLPGTFRGQRSLADYSPWGRKESDPTEHA